MPCEHALLSRDGERASTHSHPTLGRFEYISSRFVSFGRTKSTFVIKASREREREKPIWSLANAMWYSVLCMVFVKTIVRSPLKHSRCHFQTIFVTGREKMSLKIRAKRLPRDQPASERSIREKINRWWTKIKRQTKTDTFHVQNKEREQKKMLITDL